MSRTLFSVFILIPYISFSAVQAQAQLSPAAVLELRADAERAYNERDTDAALALYKQLTQANPDDPEAWFGLSIAYEWGGDWDNAIAAAERVQELGYVIAPYLAYRLARLNERAGNSAQALEWIERALQQGYEERPRIQEDEVFAGLRDHPEFIRLAAILPAGQVSRTDGLRFDVDYLVEEARRMHGSPDRPAFSPQFEQAASDLRQAIPDLSDAQVVTGMMRLLAQLDDGHTALYGPGPDTPLAIGRKVLPLKFYWFKEGVYIVDGFGPAAGLAGQRVVQIGDLTAEETLDRLSAFRGVDNPMTWRWMGPQFFLVQLQMLQQVGATSSTEYARLLLEDSEGQTSEHVIEGGDQMAQRKLRPSPAASGDVPLYLANVDREYWLHPFTERGTLYFQFNQVRDAADQGIADFAAHLRERLVADGISNLVVDVRHNNGGNNSLLHPLVKAMVAFEQSSADNRIYVITGRNTFSAAQNFINRVEQWTDAIFVGEPSASSPNFVGEETNLLLPYSRIRGSISTRYWQDSSPGDNRPWITPAVPVEPTAADYFAGRDAAMEAVFELINSRQDR